jgi:nudix-type nucleoside diphosphatase (YffH/AdpP family)
MKSVVIHNRKTLSEEKYKLQSVACSFISRSGRRIQKIAEVYERPSASTILLYDPGNKTILLTEQFRPPAFLNGGEESLMETCAGLIDKNEDPEDTIIREVKEELGYAVTEVKKLFALYSSPGGNTELIYYFTGQYQKNGKTSGGGNTNEGEDITAVEWTYEEARTHLSKNRIRDAKTMILLQYALLNGIFV